MTDHEVAGKGLFEMMAGFASTPTDRGLVAKGFLTACPDPSNENDLYAAFYALLQVSGAMQRAAFGHTLDDMFTFQVDASHECPHDPTWAARFVVACLNGDSEGSFALWATSERSDYDQLPSIAFGVVEFSVKEFIRSGRALDPSLLASAWEE